MESYFLWLISSHIPYFSALGPLRNGRRVTGLRRNGSLPEPGNCFAMAFNGARFIKAHAKNVANGLEMVAV